MPKKNIVLSGARNEKTTVEKTEVFKLKLPSELDIQPKWEVAVSKNYTAKIFEVQYDRINNKTGVRDGWETRYRIRVAHNKSGLAPRTGNWEYNYGRCDLERLLDVTNAIENIAREMQPKTRTVQTVDEDY